MNTDTETKRGPGRPRKEHSPLEALKTAAEALAEAIDALPHSDAQRINITLNGNHEFTIADALRTAKALASCANTTKPI